MQIAVVEWYTLRNRAQKRCVLTANSHGKTVEQRAKESAWSRDVNLVMCLPHGKSHHERIAFRASQKSSKPQKPHKPRNPHRNLANHSRQTVALRLREQFSTCDRLHSSTLGFDHKNSKAVRGAEMFFCRGLERSQLCQKSYNFSYLTIGQRACQMPWSPCFQ